MDNTTFYRADIDGLRAVAVLSVVLFHANIYGFSGGFVGVDVFFVISGYLITSIIQREFLEGQFSILKFYERRARRILPALLAMMAATLVAGWILLTPLDYDLMGQSILSALFFVSNMWFWQNSGGYFDGATDYLPMLHTWSLAVEEQFYIFFPLLLLLLHRIGHRSCLSTITLLVLGSLALAIWATPQMPSAAFYLLPTRIWELGVGSILAIGSFPLKAARIVREGIGVLGLAGVLVPVLAYDGHTIFPGLAAVPPVLGAAALIWVGIDGRLVLASRLLSLRPFVWIGLISYSLYLWHWPIMAFVRNWTFSVELDPSLQIATTLSSLAMGWVSWRLIEKPFRVRVREGGLSQGQIFALSSVGIACVGAFAGLVALNGGMERQRFSLGQVQLLESFSRDDSAEECFGGSVSKSPCIFGDKNGEVKWVLWGDSHAKSLLPALDRVASEQGVGLMFVASPACPPLPGVMELYPGSYFDECLTRRKTYLQWIEAADEIDTVFLAARWPMYIEGTRMPVEDRSETILYDSRKGKPTDADRSKNIEVIASSLTALRDGIRAQNKKLVLLGTAPEIPWDVAESLKALVLFGTPLPAPVNKSAVFERQARSDVLLAQVADLPGSFFIPLGAIFCDPVCPTHADDAAFYRDNNHLTSAGAIHLALPILLKEMPEILKSEGDL